MTQATDIVFLVWTTDIFGKKKELVFICEEYKTAEEKAHGVLLIEPFAIERANGKDYHNHSF